MNDAWEAYRRGLGLASRTWWKWAQIPVFLIGLAALVMAPFGLERIANPLLKVGVWIFLLWVIVITAVCLGLMPYWGQREITRDCERTRDDFERWMWEARRERDHLRDEINRLRPQ